MMLSPILNKLGVSVTGTGIAFGQAGATGAAAGTAVQIAWWPLLVITALLIAAFLAINAAIKNSPAGKLKEANENLEQQEKLVEDLTNKYEELNSSLASIEEKTQMLDQYIQGTQAWKDKVTELNQELANLVTEYPEFAAFLRVDNGVLTIDENKTNFKNETYKDVEQSYKERLDTATLAKMAFSSQVAQQKISNSLEGLFSWYENDAAELLSYNEESFNAIMEDFFIQVSQGKFFTETGELSEDKMYEFFLSFGEEFNRQFSTKTMAYEFSHNYTPKELLDYSRDIHEKSQSIEGNELAIVNDLLKRAALSDKTQELMYGIDYSLLRGGWNYFFEENKSNRKIATKAEKDAFEEATNYDHVSGKKFEVDGKSEKFTKNYIKQVAQKYNAEKDFLTALNLFGAKLNGMKETAQREAFSQLLSEGGSLIDEATLRDYFSWARNNAGLTTSDYFQFKTGLQLTPDDLKVLGFTEEEEFSKQLNENLANGLRNYIYSKKDLIKVLNKTGKLENSNFMDALNQADKKEEALSQTFKILETIGNTEIQNSAIEYLTKNLNSISVEGLEEINSVMDSINWENPIEAAGKLRKAVGSANKEVSDFAQILIDTNNKKIGFAAQFKQVINSDEFGELNEEMIDLIKTTGQLDSSNINEWREECDLLNKMMKQTGITAAGMAKALTMLQKEELKLSQMTDAVLAAFAAFDGVGEQVYNTVKSIENFDLGIDEGSIADFISSSYDTLNENISAGEWGNSQSKKIIEFIFGKDALKQKNGEYLKGVEYAQAQKDYAKFLEENTENMSSAWKDLASGEFMNKKIAGISGFQALSSGTGVQLAEGLELLKHQNGGVELKGYENFSVPDLINILTKYTGSEQLANMMFTDLANSSSNIQDYQDSWNYNQAIEGFMGKTRKGQVMTGFQYGRGYVQEKDKDGNYTQTDSSVLLETFMDSQTIIDKSEIQALMKLYNKSEEEIMSSLQEYGTFKVTDFYDDNGILKSNDEIIKNIDSTLGAGGEKWIEGFSTRLYNTTTGELSRVQIDYEDLLGELENIGIPEAARASLALDMAQGLQEGAEAGFELMYKTTSGTEVPITITPEMSEADLLAKFQEADIDAEAAVMGEAVASALASFGFDPDALQNSFDEATKEASFEVEVGPNLSQDAQQILQSALSGIQGLTVNVQGNLTGVDGVEGELAKGIKNSPTSLLALTGEEGPELVQTASGYYITGQSGPELAYINRGDTVYTAKETEQILKSKPNAGPRYEDGIIGYGDIFDGPSGKRAVGSDEKKKDIDVDKLYNILADIEEALRTREKLEREYTAILDRLNTNAKDLVEQSKKQIAALEDERTRQEARKEARINQSDAYMEENANYKKYAWVETRDDGERVIQIDWDAINNISDDKEKENVQEYLSNIEKFEDDINEAEDAIIEIDDTVKEIKERGKDEYFDLEKQIKEALVNDRQKEIDKLSEINDSINDTNSRLLEAMSYSIEQQRQARENDKTEQEISDKQRQLAYLQQDTSGANALDIMKLQKEIDEAQEDYTDTLIDQKISELQKQNDDAATQRQQQIDIAQAQLDHYVESGQVWNDVYELMSTGIGPNGAIIDNSGLMDLLKKDADFASMSKLEKLRWGEELNDKVGQALAWLDIGNQLEDIGKTEGPITFTAKDAQGNVHTVTGTVNSDGSVTTAEGATYSGVYQNYDGSYTTSEEWIDPATIQQQVEETVPEEPPKPEITEYVLRGVASAIWRGDLGWGTGSERMSKLTEIFGADNAAKIKRYVEKKDYKQFDPSFSIAPEHSYNKMKEMFGTSGETYGGSSYSVGSSNTPYLTEEEISSVDRDRLIYDPTGDSTGKWRTPINSVEVPKEIADRAPEGYFIYENGKYYKKTFKTGGLADFTGPAWLDGTKARPEYVLNADQTKAFFNLINVLESLQHGPTSRTSTENNGDINLDIDINVESIGSDYDVEQVADTIKRMIANDARYRNNNTVNLTR